jgi:hypothetical protein
MKSAEFTYSKTVSINGVLVPKFRGQKQGQVMSDRSKYNRKEKHKGKEIE